MLSTVSSPYMVNFAMAKFLPLSKIAIDIVPKHDLNKNFYESSNFGFSIRLQKITVTYDIRR